MPRKTGKYNEPSPWPDEIPHTIYFYYAKRINGHIGEKAAYIWPEGRAIDLALLKVRIGELTSNARKATPDRPRCIGKAIKDVPWWKISYLVIAVDDEDGNDEVFQAGNAMEITRFDEGAPYRNHCFFDGGDGEINVQGESPIWAAWTVNHMKNRSGEDIPSDKFHKFSFQFRPNGRRLQGRHDEDHGTNMGPPIGPPP